MIYIAGHSLGGARAALYAWSRASRGLPVAGVYTFGSPRPGNGALCPVASSVPLWRTIQNGRDVIPAVPIDLEIVGEEYCHPTPPEQINEPPGEGDPWGLFGWHHVELYQAGVAKLEERSASTSIATACDQVRDLYWRPAGFDWLHDVDGQFWGLRIMPNGDRLLIARGSTTALDWLDDFDAIQIPVYDAWVSEGFWKGVGPILDVLDKACAG